MQLKLTHMPKYTIKAGQHSPLGFQFGIANNPIKFRFMFEASCLYNTEFWPEQDKLDINKLVGGTNGLTDKYSARFGWRCTDLQNIDVVTYIHEGGAFAPMSEIMLAKVAPNEWHTGELIFGKNFYSFKVDGGVPITIPTSIDGTKTMKLKQFPYFGGNNVAPHNMVIHIEYI